MSTEVRERQISQEQEVPKSCNFVNIVTVLTAIAIPIITTTFAYVGAFKLLKLRMINPKFALALKIIIPATLGVGITLIEISLYIYISWRNLQKRNNLALNAPIEEIEDLDVDVTEIVDVTPLCYDVKQHILNFLSAQFIIENFRLVSLEWKGIIESDAAVDMLCLRDFPEKESYEVVEYTENPRSGLFSDIYSVRIIEEFESDFERYKQLYLNATRIQRMGLFLQDGVPIITFFGGRYIASNQQMITMEHFASMVLEIGEKHSHTGVSLSIYERIFGIAILKTLAMWYEIGDKQVSEANFITKSLLKIREERLITTEEEYPVSVIYGNRCDVMINHASNFHVFRKENYSDLPGSWSCMGQFSNKISDDSLYRLVKDIPPSSLMDYNLEKVLAIAFPEERERFNFLYSDE